MSTIALSRPRLRMDEAVLLARELYGLRATAHPLPSERDQNFLLTTETGARFVLKVARAGERVEELDLQDAALAWVAAHDPAIAVPRLHPTISGRAIATTTGPSGTPHFVRLLSYVPGSTMAMANPRTGDLLRSLGRFLAALDRALSGFSHPAARGRDLEWDPRRAREVIARDLQAVADPRRRALVLGFIELFDTTVGPLVPELRASVIHNDANDHNLLVSAPALLGRRVVGILDFGDMVHGPTVCELAVGIAYAMLGARDPILAAVPVVAGYHEVLPLVEVELETLFALAALRLCTSVCLAAQRHLEEPDNPYLAISEGPAWESLERLAAVHPRLAHYAFRNACGLPPCPRAPEVVGWLRAHVTEPAPVLATDGSVPALVDLRVGSPLFESPAEATDPTTRGERILGAIREAGASVGVARYDEARLPPDRPRSLTPSGEARTVHLGMDLFASPGTAVLAPLPGRVHGFHRGAGPLDHEATLVLAHQPPDGPPFFTLYGHLSQSSLAEVREGMAVARGQTIGSLAAPRENHGSPAHLHFQIAVDLLDRSGELPGLAAPSAREIWLSVCPDPNLISHLDEDRFGAAAHGGADLLRRREALLGRNLSLAYREPLHIVRGFAQHLYDHAGRAYLDLVNNVAHVGHGHPRVVRAAARQMAVLNTNTRYLHETILSYAERLCATLPEPLRVCFFVNSGSEANELALRLARAMTRARDVIVVDGAYHGNTTSLVEISPYKFDGPGGEGAPGHVHVVPMPDDYRGLYRREDPARGPRFAAHVGEAAEAARRRGSHPAAFICESVLSAGGQIVLPPGYLEAAYALAREVGAVCIADEVQVGFGRVGTHFWGFETQGVVPDIVTLGKPIGNGHPIGAVVTTPAIAASFAGGMEFFSTFGGNPVSCAVGLAVLDVIRDESLQARALHVGARFRSGLEELQPRHPALGDVRGLGLFLGLELVQDPVTREPAPEVATYVVERMKEQAILLGVDGPDRNVIKIKPPLCFSEDDADRVVSALDEVLGEDFVRHRG